MDVRFVDSFGVHDHDSDDIVELLCRDDGFVWTETSDLRTSRYALVSDSILLDTCCAPADKPACCNASAETASCACQPDAR